MRRPLYRLPDGIKPELDGDGHRGLWYDKFCDRWGDDAWSLKAGEDASPKLDWIRTVARNVGSPRGVGAYARRLFELVEARGGAAVVVKARTRFVTGLGRSHPVENGFAWHPTLGTPYLPGSSAKGLTRAWAQENGQDEAVVERLLGDRDRAGSVAFLDSVPLSPVPLEADVLTPHYANWTENEPPGDWRAPIPVQFLVAAPGWSMLCGIVPLRSTQAGGVTTAKGWLISALDDVGAGAKTAVGYGHFQEDTQDSTLVGWRRESRRREAMAIPEMRWRLALDGRSEEEVLDAVREHLRSEPLQDSEERRALVRAVLETGMVESWKRGEKTEQRTSTGAKKLKEYARLILDLATEFGLELGSGPPAGRKRIQPIGLS